MREKKRGNTRCFSLFCLKPCELSDTFSFDFFFFFFFVAFAFPFVPHFLLPPSRRLVSSNSLPPMASSSRARSSSPFSYRKPSSPYSSTSSSSSFMTGRLMPRSCSSSASSYFNSGGGLGSGARSMTPSRGRSDSLSGGGGSRGYGGHTPVGFASEELVAEPLDAPRSGDSISVTIRFRPLR